MTINCVMTRLGKCSYSETGCSDCQIIADMHKLKKKADKYGWHDLRKNPEDMPNDDGLYWIHVVWESGKHAEGECDYSVEDGYFDTVWNAHVIAWKKVDPFEVGE